MTIRAPGQVEAILRKLKDAGFEAYIVGGCVRDSILGRTPEDWDITTSAHPEEIKALFPRTVDTGIRHGTVTVLMGHGENRRGYEVTTYRIDGEYRDARHPENVTFTASLKEDLKRRDFTINAMAWNEEGIVDLFGGMEDLRTHVIRAVGDPSARFTEDALRIMRAVRFASQLDFRIEDHTLASVREMAPSLSRISAERIRTELEKLLVSAHPEYLQLAYESGITAVILPEFDACMQTPQNTPYHKFNVGEHILKALEEVPAEAVLRLAVLFHDIAKPLCHTRDAAGRDHFYGHAEKGVEVADRIMRRLKYDNTTRRRVMLLVRHHDDILGEDPRQLRRSIVRICGSARTDRDFIPLLLQVKEADARAHHDDYIRERLDRIGRERRMYEQILRDRDPLSLEDLAVTGQDLIAAGVCPGEQMGTLLRRMLYDVVDTPEHNTKAYLLSHKF